jgi:hypothetical protein
MKWRGKAVPNDEEIGYGKPPKANRFKPGQSGNPKGRPKGAPNVRAAFDKAMRERVNIIENGRRKSISKVEAIAKQAINKAASGDSRFVQLLMHFMQQAEAPVEELAQVSRSGEDNKSVMQSIVRRMQAAAKGEDHE